MTSSLKRFRIQGFRDKSLEYDEVETKSTSIRARHKKEGERAERENRDNTSALLELRDIEDELGTLLRLFQEQEERIREMRHIYTLPENDMHTYNGIAFLVEASDRLQDYQKQTKEMIERVKSTRQDFDKLLQMVQRQAQVDEVRLSRQQADLASAQNRSVMIFTTFTVIFLPLMFFTSLFGMNTQEWGGENFLDLRTIGWISLPASAVLIVASLIVAWSTNVRRFLHYVHHKVAKKKKKAKAWLIGKARYHTATRKPSKKLIERRKRREEEMAVRKEKKRLRKEMNHDFWERHRTERELEYKVPATNRRSIGVARARARAKLAQDASRRVGTM